MERSTRDFPQNARAALADDRLQAVLGATRGFEDKRRRAVARLPEFEALRDQARAIKDESLAHLDVYLERFEARVQATGGQVHWALTAAEACRAVAGICRAAGATRVIKGKSMVTEEIGLNAHLAAAGMAPVETDLGEYIIQLRGEAPSHIIAPAIHLDRRDVASSFRAAHDRLPADRALDTPAALVGEARRMLRERFLAAEVGITGANFLVAETGATVIVTNEGNGDLTQSLPPVHIVVAGIEKLVPTLEDAMVLLRLLARSATGQEFSAYTTVTTGPRRAEDLDGPTEFHVVLVDNGRSALLAGAGRDVLRCIRCGACMNHCPVYKSLGGHAYGWVYPGPIGAALTPGLIGIEDSYHLPGASTFCGRCEEVCPVKIPLPSLMRRWRTRAFAVGVDPLPTRAALRLWGALARRPRLYRWATGLGVRVLGVLGRRRGRFRRLPLVAGWTAWRDLPAPEGATFHARLRARRRDSGR